MQDVTINVPYYLRNSVALGRSKAQIARDLGVTPRTVYRWFAGETKPSFSSSELRNVYRKASYSQLRREAFLTPKQARAGRSWRPIDVIQETETGGGWMRMVVDSLYDRWNRSARKHGKPILSKDEIEKRIREGLRRGKSREEIENY